MRPQQNQFKKYLQVLYPNDIMALASNMEDVAQLAERRPVEANVAGSFPVILPKKLVFSKIKTTFKKEGGFDFKITFSF